MKKFSLGKRKIFKFMAWNKVAKTHFIDPNFYAVKVLEQTLEMIGNQADRIDRHYKLKQVISS